SRRSRRTPWEMWAPGSCRDLEAQLLNSVAAHDLPFGSFRDATKSIHEAQRVADALAVREIGAEHHVVLAHDVDDSPNVILEERVDVDVSLEHIDGVLVELLGHDLVCGIELLEQIADPAPAVPDEEDLKFGEARQRAVTDHRRQGVFDGPVAHHDLT